jgi:uncharacterized membrane protein YqjE
MLHADPRPETPTADLVKEAIQDARELVQVEIELAKDDLRREARRLRASAIVLGVAAATAFIGLVMVIVAISLAIGRGPLPALIIGLSFLAVAAIAAVFGVSHVPKKPLERTRARLETDVKALKEGIA